MKQTKGAIGNLLNRYKAVLKKCHLLNTFGSLAVASMLVMGGAGVAQAADNEKYPLKGAHTIITIKGASELTFEPEGVPGAEAESSASKDIIGGYWVNDNSQESVDDISTRITIRQGENVDVTYNGEVIGGSLIQGEKNDTRSVSVNDTYILIEEGASIGGYDTKGKYNNVMAGGKVNGYGTSTVTGKATLIVKGTVDGTAIGGGTAKKPADKDNEVVASVGTTDVTINGTVSYGVVGGGVADAYNAGTPDGKVTSSVDTTNVTINEGATVGSLLQPSSLTKISAAVVGGGLASGSNALASAGTTNVTINGGEISNKVVAGGAAINGGKVKVDHTYLTMAGGNVTSDLVGGNLLSGGTEEAGITSTNVHVTGGTVHGEIYGGTYVRNTEATASVDTAYVTIDDGTIGSIEPQSWAQYVVGGGKAMSNGNYTAQSDVTTTTVTITGGEIVRGAVIGGGFTRAQGTAGGTASATVENATVAVSGGSLSGVVAGGLAESTASSTDATSSSTVTTANLNISGNATINGIRYMANDEATEGNYEETPASDIAVVGGGLAYSMNGKAATSAVTKSNTSISGGTINGSVVAGGMANGSNATSSVTTANLDITGGTINGSVYAGGASLESGIVNVGSFAVMITGGTITGDVVAGNYPTADQTNLAMIATLADETTTTTSGTITIGGMADVKGQVLVDKNNVVTTIDGSEATVEKGFTSTGTNNTLAFENYTAAFDKTATGFENYNAGAGSTVRVDNISTGSKTEGDTGIFAGTDNAFTLGGEGTFVADKVTVGDAGDNLNIEGTLTVAEGGTVSVTSSGASLKVNDGGTFDVSQASNITTTARDDIQVETGGTLNMNAIQVNNTFTGATLASGATVNLDGNLSGDEALRVETLTSKFGSNGLINAGDNAVTGMYKETAVDNGKIEFDDIQSTNIATNASKNLVVTGVETSDKLKGGWKGLELAQGNTGLSVKEGTLQLAGEAGDSDFEVVNGGVNFNESNATLLLGEADTNRSGTIGGSVTFASEPINMRLEVLGNENAAFFVDGNIDGQNGTKGNVKASGGVSLTANGNITAGTLIVDGSTITAAGGGQEEGASAGDITTTHLTAQNGGTVYAKNDIQVLAEGSVTLTNKGTIEAGNDVTLNVDVENADGTIIAGHKISADTQNIIKADNGQLYLKASLISAKNITATKITASKLYVTENVIVDAGFLNLTQGKEEASEVGSLTLSNGTQGAIVGSLQLKNNDQGVLAVGTADDTVGGTTLSANHVNLNGGMLLVDPAWGLASSNVAVETLSAEIPAEDVIMAVNGRIGLGQNSYLAIGTDNLQWLPGAAGPLSKGGTEAALGIYKPIQIAENEAIVVKGKLMGTAPSEEGATTTTTLYDAVTNAAANTATFADNTLLVINGADEKIASGAAAISFAATDGGTLNVESGARLQIVDAVAEQTYTIVGNTQMTTGYDAQDGSLVGWQNNAISTTTDMISLEGAKYVATNSKVTVTSKLEDAQKIFPALSGEMAGLVNELYKPREDANGKVDDYAKVDSTDMGIRFLSRATDNRFLGKDKQAAAATIESAARMAFAGAVPQMTKMASDSATNSVVNRMGFANPENGAKAMNLDGKLVDDKALGLALWIAPLWSNQTGFGMEAGNLDYGYNANIGGISLGADYTWANNFRAGLMFNIGGGYAESSGDLSETTNSMTFWGVGAYGGWKYENFAVMGDVSYTSTWNSVDQDVDHRMEMGDLEADIQASAISAGLRFEYKLETQYLDLIPHVGARYMSINTWGYDVETNGGTVLEGDGFQQNIWTFPVGITFSKELEMNNDWYFKPSVDFTVIPAAGDIKAKEDVRFTGLPYSTEIETQMMDYFTWQGGLGLEFGNDNMSVGVNYTLQAGQNSTGHGVFGMFRYEF